MTQTLIEKLKALPTCDVTNDGEEIWRDKNGRYVHYDDLRAIIEDAKAENQEPFCYLCDWGDKNGLQRVAVYYGEPGSATADDWNEFPKVHQNMPLYRTQQPDLAAELVKALEDLVDCSERVSIDVRDGKGALFNLQSSQRRAKLLIAKAKEMMG